MILFDPRLLSTEPFVPHPYAALGNVFPAGAVPEPAYNQIVAKYQQLDDVVIQRITYLSDDLKVTGLAAYPRDITPGTHPIALYNRGGNRDFGMLTVRAAVGQLAPLARAGYLVFASNYRGNDGGEGREEFGGADVGDVLTLLDITRAHPGWDGANAFMIGHSRGAMMTTLAIKAGAKLNAAIGIAGPYDVTASGLDRPEIKQNVHRELIPDAGDAAYKARSAVCWPEKLNIPLLLLHGDADERVDVSHSVKLDEALTKAGMPHELVIYPGGNHALVRHWSDVMARTLDWFTRYKTQPKSTL